MSGGFPVSDLQYFYSNVRRRLRDLEAEMAPPFMMPLGLLLVIDEANGGSKTAQELVKRLFLLDAESKNVIDFYYLGWSLASVRGKAEGADLNRKDEARHMRFDLSEFLHFREALARAGVGGFGGNADLILVDAEWRKNDFVLHFERAIRIDLAAEIESGRFRSLGQFTQALIRVAEEIRKETTAKSPVWRISDRLGLAYGRESIMENVLEKLGKWIGAARLQALSVKHLGPPVKGLDFAARLRG